LTCHPHRCWALLLLFGSGCLQDYPVLGSTAQAYAEAVAAEAQPGLRAGVGMAAVAAELCAYPMDDWESMTDGRPPLPDEIADWFGVDSTASILSVPTQGLYTVFYSGGSFFDQTIGLQIVVVTPMSSLTVYITDGSAGQVAETDTDTDTDTDVQVWGKGTGDTGGEDTGDSSGGVAILATAVLQAETCGAEERAISGSVNFGLEDGATWDVTMPGGEESFLMFPEGQVLPSASSVMWTGTTEIGRAVLLTNDASEIEDGVWPATVNTNEWTATVDFELQQPDER